jgi:hypothetical protein
LFISPKLNLLRNDDESVDSALEFVKEHVHQDAKIVVRQAKTIGEFMHGMNVCCIYQLMKS